MTRELVKELKDSGWPEFKEVPDEYLLSNAPGLSELIEAFGKDRERLELFIDADGHTLTTSTSRSRDEGFVEGSTPEEAVAKLWLALNRTEAAKSSNPTH